MAWDNVPMLLQALFIAACALALILGIKSGQTK